MASIAQKLCTQELGSTKQSVSIRFEMYQLVCEFQNLTNFKTQILDPLKFIGSPMDFELYRVTCILSLFTKHNQQVLPNLKTDGISLNIF